MADLTDEEKEKIEAYRESKKEEFAKKMSDERIAKEQAKVDKEEEFKAKGWKRVAIEKAQAALSSLSAAKASQRLTPVKQAYKTKTTYVPVKKKGKTIYVPVKKKVKAFQQVRRAPVQRTAQPVFGFGVNFGEATGIRTKKKVKNTGSFGVDWSKA